MSELELLLGFGHCNSGLGMIHVKIWRLPGKYIYICMRIYIYICMYIIYQYIHSHLELDRMIIFQRTPIYSLYTMFYLFQDGCIYMCMHIPWLCLSSREARGWDHDLGMYAYCYGMADLRHGLGTEGFLYRNHP